MPHAGWLLLILTTGSTDGASMHSIGPFDTLEECAQAQTATMDMLKGATGLYFKASTRCIVLGNPSVVGDPPKKEEVEKKEGKSSR